MMVDPYAGVDRHECYFLVTFACDSRVDPRVLVERCLLRSRLERTLAIAATRGGICGLGAVRRLNTSYAQAAAGQHSPSFGCGPTWGSAPSSIRINTTTKIVPSIADLLGSINRTQKSDFVCQLIGVFVPVRLRSPAIVSCHRVHREDR